MVSGIILFIIQINSCYVASSQCTTALGIHGEKGKSKQGNILNDLREKWLEVKSIALDKRYESVIVQNYRKKCYKNKKC